MKVDAQRIIAHIELQQQLYVNDIRKWWPKFVFHTTSLENAVSIIDEERIYSRESVLGSHKLKYDIADSSVIQHTDEKWKSYTRFYLRPKTPTLYKNEGVKPIADIVNNAHCAVPICFMFDSKKILTRGDCIFSDGNLASGSVKTGNDAQFFESLPFAKIFHTGPHSDPSITFHRNAEAVVPDFVSFDDLEFIVCRSEAEKETLLNLIHYSKKHKWGSKIGVATRYSAFNEEWNFIREVKWDGSNVIIKFNEQQRNSRGPFKFSIFISQTWDRENNSWESTTDAYILPNDYHITLNSYANKTLDFKIMLDTHIVYSNTFHHHDDSPF